MRIVSALLAVAFAQSSQALPSVPNIESASGKRIVFIDEALDASQLGLGASDGYRLIPIRRGEQPLQQIAQVLRDLRLRDDTAPSAVEIFSHGADGGLHLGGQWLDEAALRGDKLSLAMIRDSLAEDADINLYACDLAAGERGRSFVDSLAALTGADVAASTDATGHAGLGGDWELEYRRGAVADSPLVTAALRDGYRGVLSHFRGGLITWQAADLDNDGQKNDVLFTVKTAWLHNVYDPLVGLGTTPALTISRLSESQIHIGPLGQEDYTLQTTLLEARNLNPNTQYLVYYSGCCRISNLKNPAYMNWKIQTLVNLQAGNLAPKVDLPLIFEVPQLESDGVTPLADWAFDLSITDPNADRLRYRLATIDELGGATPATPQPGAPTGLSLDPDTGLLTWVGSGALPSGLYSVGIVAEDLDSSGTVKSKTHIDLMLDLLPKAATPVITSPNIPETRNVVVPKGSTFDFTISGAATDTTALGNVQGALTKTSDDNFKFAPGPDPTSYGLDPGTYPITFEIDADDGSTAKSYLVLNFIVPDPDAPLIVNLEADQTAYSSSAAQLVDDAADAVLSDANDSDLNGGKLRFNASFLDAQDEVLSIYSVGDGAGEIRLTGSDIFYEGRKIGEVDASENGVAKALTIHFTSVDASLPAVQQLIRSLSYENTASPYTVGVRSLSLYIEDSLGLGNAYNFSIDVLPRALTLSGIPASEVMVGDSYSFTPTVSDPGALASYTATNLPAWASFDANTGKLSGNPALGDIGSYSGIIITVTDGSGRSDSLGPFSIQVRGDSDGDGVLDDIEITDGTDPGDPDDFTDSDGDGVPDEVETSIDGTDPNDGSDFTDTDGDGFSDYEEGQEGTDPNDPNAFPMARASVDAKGLFTKVSNAELLALGLIVDGDAASCCGDYPISPVDGEPLFAPGRHLIDWASGQRSTLDVHPLISLSKDQLVGEDQPASLQVWLNGRAPSYPLTVAYSVTGSADGADHDLRNGSVTFSQGETLATKNFRIYADAATEGDETIVVSLLDNGANLGSKSVQVFTIVEQNVAPEVVLSVEQGGDVRKLLGSGDGSVSVTAQVSDANSGDSHSLSWTVSDVAGNSVLITDSNASDTVFAFDPAGLSTGVYLFKVWVSDDGSPAKSREASVYVQLLANLPSLGSGDSDGDGISDQIEGLGDSDGDGIPDYLDAIHAPNVLPERGNELGAYLIECEPSASCRLGAHALIGQSGGTNLTDADIANQSELIPDPDFAGDGGLFNFEGEIPVAGQSLRVAIPQRAPVPAGAVYRKYAVASGWNNFVENPANQLHSTSGEAGYCPPPGDAAWQPGLGEGHWCVQLTIEDGGPNDADGTANRRIVDPGMVASPRRVDFTTSGGGSAGLFGLLGLLAALLRRRGVTGKLACATAATALLGSAAALAGDPADGAEWWSDVYLSAAVGLAHTGAGRSDMRDAFAANGISATVQDVENQRFGGSIGLGYPIDDIWSVELAYLDLGEVVVDFSAPGVQPDLAEVHPESGAGLSLSALYQRPLGGDLQLRARLGLFAWDGDYGTLHGTSPVDSASDSGTDLFWGIGAGYRIDARWAVNLEFQRYDFDRDASNFLALGLEHRFR